MQGIVRAIGPHTDGPVNQTNELKVGEGSILELQTGVWLLVVELSFPLLLNGDCGFVETR